MSKIGQNIKQPAAYTAFVPNKFPPPNLINWDDDLIMLLSKADLAIGKLNAMLSWWRKKLGR